MKRLLGRRNRTLAGFASESPTEKIPSLRRHLVCANLYVCSSASFRNNVYALVLVKTFRSHDIPAIRRSVVPGGTSDVADATAGKKVGSRSGYRWFFDHSR